MFLATALMKDLGMISLMLIGPKYIYFLISLICCICSHLWVIVKHFFQGHYQLLAYAKQSFMETQRPSLLSQNTRRVETMIQYG